MSGGRGSKDEEDQLKKRSSNMYADVLRVPNFLLIMTVFCCEPALDVVGTANG